MKRVFLLGLMLCTVGGCLRPLTCRLDSVNAQLADTNAKLTEMSQKLDEANQKLGTFEKAARMIVPGLDKKQ